MVEFTFYPTSNRVPGVFVEMDPSQANSGVALQRSLVIGQILATGTATPAFPVEVQSIAQVLQLCGQGSMLAQMAQDYLANDTFADLWLLPLQDNAAGVAATGSMTVVGPATGTGTLNLYIAGQLVQVGVASGDTAAVIATNIVAAIAAKPTLPVSAVAATATVTLTCHWKGLTGNDIDLRANYLGALGGESYPPGVSVTFVAMSGGTANPLLPTALANLSDQTYDWIVTPYNDTASLDAMKTFFADDTGRWSWEEMLYGGGFSAVRGTLGVLSTFGEARNDQHMSIIGFNDSPDPVWTWAASIGAHCAASLRVDPGLPLQYIGTQLKAPPVPSRFDIAERNTLLYDGISTFRVADDGTVTMERMCTTYQKNAAGAADNSYLDVETMYGLMFVARDLTNFLLTRYARKKLVSDTTQILAGANTVNSTMIKASVVNEYRQLEVAGAVQNSATFAQNIIVENAGNGLVKILAPVDLVNQLRQIAILLQFRKS
jgi:phage tail sheath gpL-like